MLTNQRRQRADAAQAGRGGNTNAARELDPTIPVILMTAQASLQSAIQAVNQGAYHYIQKPFANDELVAILRRACEYRAVRVENKQLRQEIKRRDRAGVSRPIGKSRRFMDVMKLVFQRKFKPVVDVVWPLERAAKAHERLSRNEQFGKIVLTV